MRAEKPGRLSVKAIETFIAVVEEQSLSLGAKRLGSSISAASLQLSNLERALGAKLIERTAQRFALTDAGLLFRDRALRILDEIDGARADLSMQAGAPHLTLRLAVVEDFDNHVLPRWLSGLSNVFPNARFIVKSGPSHENFTTLSSRATDMVVASDAMDPADWIEQHPLLRDPYLLVTAHGIEPGLGDLMSRPFVRYAREQHMGRQIEAQLRRVRAVPPMAHEFSSNQAVFAMVAACDGWAISTASAVHGTLSHRATAYLPLTVHRLPVPAFSRSLVLYARKDILGAVPAKAADSLRAALRDVFAVESESLKLPILPDVLEPE